MSSLNKNASVKTSIAHEIDPNFSVLETLGDLASDLMNNYNTPDTIIVGKNIIPQLFWELRRDPAFTSLEMEDISVLQLSLLGKMCPVVVDSILPNRISVTHPYPLKYIAGTQPGGDRLGHITDATAVGLKVKRITSTQALA